MRRTSTSEQLRTLWIDLFLLYLLQVVWFLYLLPYGRNCNVLNNSWWFEETPPVLLILVLLFNDFNAYLSNVTLISFNSDAFLEIKKKASRAQLDPCFLLILILCMIVALSLTITFLELLYSFFTVLIFIH